MSLTSDNELNIRIATLCGHQLVRYQGKVIGIRGWWGFRPLPDYVTSHTAAFDMLMTLPRETPYHIERLPEVWRVTVGSHIAENIFFSMAASEAFLQHYRYKSLN